MWGPSYDASTVPVCWHALCVSLATARLDHRSDSVDSTLPVGVDGLVSTSMFPLPPEYAAAVQQKQESVSKLRGAVKSVRRGVIGVWI